MNDLANLIGQTFSITALDPVDPNVSDVTLQVKAIDMFRWVDGNTGQPRFRITLIPSVDHRTDLSGRTVMLPWGKLAYVKRYSRDYDMLMSPQGIKLGRYEVRLEVVGPAASQG